MCEHNADRRPIHLKLPCRQVFISCVKGKLISFRTIHDNVVICELNVWLTGLEKLY